MKVVLDAMLWVSYCTMKGGYRHRLIERARRQRVRLFVSDFILAELEAVLMEVLELSRRFAGLARRAVLRMAKQTDLAQLADSFVPGDPDDDPIVQTALACKSDYLVTADKEILKLKKVHDLEILTAQEWEDILQSS